MPRCDYGTRLPSRADPTRALAPAQPGSSSSSSSSSSSDSGNEDWKMSLPASLRGASPFLLFRLILSANAWRLEPHVRQQHGLSFAFLCAESIRLLRDRVENEGGDIGVRDETISAVATLAGIEHERGNTKMLRMHLEGLKRMVNIRGGLNAIRENNPMVANSVFWAFAVALYEAPYPNLDAELPPFFPNEHDLALPSPAVVSIFQDFGPIHEEPPPLDLTESGVNPGIAVIVNSIQHVSQLVPTASAYPTASTSMVILTRMCTLLSHLLSLPRARLYPEIDTNATLAEAALISESVRFATLLHVFTPWRGLPPDGTLAINHILHQLMASLKQLLANATSRNNTVLLWMLTVGGVSAGQTPERAWFVSHLVELTEELNISNWEGMKSHVRRVIWHERLCENSHQKLWEEVMTKRRELDDGMGVNTT
ncbi:uncharacterized protein LY89DRAFT_717616 [Mollisia scopiformis]|uniref:Uncharacterized protein n=1 Tax=Mollisia scopiformis TaxID=149040 RepID=A0A194XE01_MOLSC|nr:uncharacterized protein LY89DRAFT_717616 [Mollisia scopiformis]KUJ17977.1 hypothetical protein LY89DRAFT_717616 [Mollisia scopiformis]